MTGKRGETAEIQRPEEIPQGMTEDEVDAFWLTHSLGDHLLEQMEPFPEDFPVPPRAEQGQAAGAELDNPARVPSRGQIILGVATIGLLAAGFYIAYRLGRASVATNIFMPTRVPYSRVPHMTGTEVDAARSARKAIGAG
jgi:hypothetical protein